MRLLEIKRITGTLGPIHIIGIGGIGMSGIAEILHNMGYKVQGSDLSEGPNVDRLIDLGITVYKGHNEENIKDAAFIVRSTAVKDTNVEIQAARSCNIPIISRAEMLAEIVKLKTTVAVSGSHGKTTTTTLVATLFEEAGLAPTVINGGIINNKSTNAYLGKGDYLVVEADESDATFIKLPATMAVITNIDPEHLDFYGNFENLQQAFYEFLENLPFYGFGVANIDCPNTRKIVEKVKNRKVFTYSLEDEKANFYGTHIRYTSSSSEFDVVINLPNTKTIITSLSIPTPARHNVQNSLAAIAIGFELEFGVDNIKKGLNSFKGVKRRFTQVAEIGDIRIVDDYAHHPAEILATLAAARNTMQTPENKIVAIVQPHRYSRLRNLFEEFKRSVTKADIIYISDVYSAGEEFDPEYNTDKLIESLAKEGFGDKVKKLASEEDLAEIFYSCKPKDLMLFMGAGSVSKWAYNLAEKLQKLSKANMVV